MPYIKEESPVEWIDYNCSEEILSSPDSEIESFMCSEKEKEARSILWNEINKDYILE